MSELESALGWVLHVGCRYPPWRCMRLLQSLCGHAEFCSAASCINTLFRTAAFTLCLLVQAVMPLSHQLQLQRQLCTSGWCKLCPSLSAPPSAPCCWCTRRPSFNICCSCSWSCNSVPLPAAACAAINGLNCTRDISALPHEYRVPTTITVEAASPDWSSSSSSYTAAAAAPAPAIPCKAPSAWAVLLPFTILLPLFRLLLLRKCRNVTAPTTAEAVSAHPVDERMA